MLRHTAASLMSDAGVPIEVAADQLGHRDTRMLSLHYRHRVRPPSMPATRSNIFWKRDRSNSARPADRDRGEHSLRNWYISPVASPLDIARRAPPRLPS